jgi:prepilin-type N-terminal cleavage/methylation domain-containing protein
MSRRECAGYTMVELLVCIAIIGILAAIIFPVFSAARGQAYLASCVGNLRQIGLAMKLYYEDWDRWPPWPTLDILQEQMRLPNEIFICRADPKRGTDRLHLFPAPGRHLELLCSYHEAFPCVPGTREYEQLYSVWVNRDPLAGPLVVCDHHDPPGAHIEEKRPLGVFADGHVARCKLFVRYSGEVTDGYFWPIFE